MDRQLTPTEKESQAKNYPRKQTKDAFRISVRLAATLSLFMVFTMVFKLISNNEKTNQHLSHYESRGFAPNPEQFSDPVIQVYAARTWGVKGKFAVHTWLAYKESSANHYEVVQVIGWKQEPDGNVVFTEATIADKTWWGNEPMLLFDVRGQTAGDLIPKLKSAITSYPWSKEYVVYPGPNSNTFVSWVAERVPELKLDLPATAIGKDWRPLEHSFRESPSGTGITASLLGLLGIQLGIEEGLEINLAGLHFEVDLLDLKVGLPLIGNIHIWWVLLFFALRYLLLKFLKKKGLSFIHI